MICSIESRREAKNAASTHELEVSVAYGIVLQAGSSINLKFLQNSNVHAVFER